MSKLSRLGDAELVGTFEHDTPEWHEARAALMGSSDVASILGVGYKSAFTLWHEKAGIIAREDPDERTKRKFAYGHHMEPFVDRLFLDKHPERNSQTTGIWRNSQRIWQGCSPDRIVFHKTAHNGLSVTRHEIEEIKTFPMLSDWQDGPPAGYVAQLKWQLDVFNFNYGWITGYANLSGDYVEYLYELDPFEAEATRAVVKGFADSITDGTPPEIDGSLGTYQTLRKLNPSLNPKEEREIPQDIAEQYLEARDNLKVADSELTKWKGHLLAHMGTAQYALYDGRKIASRVAVKDSVPYLKEA